ncbi:MAG: hypothetical protein IAB19_06565 [Proteobacteria bacterium]|uniref:Uncharacterized protein n=1 Tax=Candidatus Avisuccinivibrio stercorigallinarum TaxID=2840704 RepID=A0A9D9DCX3_9GAMM|nr:hypothetical protein [Candidatus Avisuccinivibrio stercorigallinarum]
MKKPDILSVVYYTGFKRWTAPLDVVDTFEPLIEGFEPADLVSGRYFLLDVKHGEYQGGTENLCSMIIRAERAMQAVPVPLAKNKFAEYVDTFSDIIKYVNGANGAQFSEPIRNAIDSWARLYLHETVGMTYDEIERLLMDKSYIDQIRERIQAQRKKDEKRAVKRALAVADAEAEKEKQRALAEAGAEAEAEKQRALAEAAEKNQRALAEAEENKQRAVAEVKKEKDLALLRMLKDSIFSLYQCRFFHSVPEEVQKTVDNAQPKDMPALHAISDYLSGHKGDEKEFMRFAKTSLA